MPLPGGGGGGTEGAGGGTTGAGGGGGVGGGDGVAGPGPAGPSGLGAPSIGYWAQPNATGPATTVHINARREERFLQSIRSGSPGVSFAREGWCLKPRISVR